jgi:hypothetical protein
MLIYLMLMNFPRCVCVAKGWSNYESFFLFIRWMAWQLDCRYAEQRNAGQYALLLVDRHKSRFDPDMLEFAMAHNILILSFPPNATSFLQPLDLTVHGPLKAKAAHFQKEMLRQNIALTQDSVLTHAIYPAWNQSFTAANIQSGFRTAGIYPFNPQAIPDSQLQAAQAFSETRPSLVEFVEDLKQEANPPQPLPKHPLSKELEPFVGVPVYRESEKTGKRQQVALLLTDPIVMSHLRRTRLDKAKKKGGKKRARHDKKARGKPTAKPGEKEHNKSEGDSCDELEDAADDSGDDGYSSSASEDISSDDDDKKTWSGSDLDYTPKNQQSSSAQDAVMHPVESKKQRSKSSERKTATASSASIHETSSSSQNLSKCPRCPNLVGANEGIRCTNCSQAYHLKCLESKRKKFQAADNFLCLSCTQGDSVDEE